MKEIVIVGAGVAGGYLANLIHDNFVIYDGWKQRGCRCGWGSSKSLLDKKLKTIGLNLYNYYLCSPDWMLLNGLRFRVLNGIMFDKRRMVQDMTKGIDVIPRYVDNLQNLKADIVINATGNPLIESQVSYTVQWKVKLEGAEERVVYIWWDPKRIGYGWMVPLDEDGKIFHVGAGSLFGSIAATSLTKEMLAGYKLKIGKVYCGCEKKLDFGSNLPVFGNSGRVVSVGEAVGCVHPLTGEGILPSIKSAEFLAESLEENGFPMNYLFKVEEIIKEYSEAQACLEMLKKHRRRGIIKVVGVMRERAKKRTQPQVNRIGKLKALMKFLL